MMADALAGRNMEVESNIGNVVKLAKEHGVKTLILRTIYLLTVGLDTSFNQAR
ncbi:hypothetical protein BJ878DRAFT_519799 [Calycina marina]|uniref:Ketopantoate reductase C-terminal domain-containing protein n=1 Tax=Calycina marina TaxID=1763456 RepID=A0A9P7YXL8_9HELO|nr:hypothetical protein BJ878DRAFT_519799 [Calycina marina]